MPERVWLKLARTDLLEIVDYISDDSPDAAQRVKDDIEMKAKKLSEFPKIGRLGRDEDTPEEGLNMRLRAELMIQITKRVKEWDVTQKEAAQRLGITKSRLNDLLNGRINNFVLDALISLTCPAHLHVELTLKDEETAVV